MENQLYIRVRGRVLGPYDQEKLKSLARRGQLSRLQELSQDATNWVRASTYPELFVSEDPPPVAVASQAVSESRPATSGDGHAPRGSARWWYNKNGAEAGPVDQTALQSMLASGQLGPDDIVWAEGMPQWVTARQAPGLLPTHNGSGLQGLQHGAAEASKDELPASLCKSATNSRPWVAFISMVCFIYAGLSVVAGILALIHGAKHHSTDVVAGALFVLIYAIDVAVGGFLLLNYANHLAGLDHSAHAVVLEKAIDASRSFWIYVSVHLIIGLAFLVIGLVWIVAASGSFPW